MISEFELIKSYFTRPAPSAVLGVGDDAALVEVPPGEQLVVSTDMLVSGTHFFPDVDPYRLGHKCLAVNLSDMAAMGATPRWFTLSLSLSDTNEDWLAAFSKGMLDLADQFATELVGGDTTGGPFAICVQILGTVPVGQALLRAGARAGDDIWVSGTLGDAALALAALQGKLSLSDDALRAVRDRLECPMPRVALGIALRGLANSAIDVSDGLLADLGHILERSDVGASLQWNRVPLSVAAKYVADSELVRRCAMTGGDDYELCFTASPIHKQQIESLARTLSLPISRVGIIIPTLGIEVRDEQGSVLKLDKHGYDHFA